MGIGKIVVEYTKIQLEFKNNRVEHITSLERIMCLYLESDF
jgi:hypothetical protein